MFAQIAHQKSVAYFGLGTGILSLYTVEIPKFEPKEVDVMTEEKFVDIETKLSHQEFAIEELQEIVMAQTKDISLLKSAIKRLDQKLRAAKDGDLDIGPADEKPPHY